MLSLVSCHLLNWSSCSVILAAVGRLCLSFSRQLSTNRVSLQPGSSVSSLSISSPRRWCSGTSFRSAVEKKNAFLFHIKRQRNSSFFSFTKITRREDNNKLYYVAKHFARSDWFSRGPLYGARYSRCYSLNPIFGLGFLRGVGGGGCPQPITLKPLMLLK